MAVVALVREVQAAQAARAVAAEVDSPPGAVETTETRVESWGARDDKADSHRILSATS